MGMSYEHAVRILRAQDKELRKLNRKRFTAGGYEYRLAYEGGFAPGIRIDRRPVGKRNFRWYGNADVSRCATAGDAMAAVMALIPGADTETAVWPK